MPLSGRTTGSMPAVSRTGWVKTWPIPSHDACSNRAMLAAGKALLGMRVRLETEIRGSSRVTLGKRGGGFRRRVEAIIEGEPAVTPDLVPIVEAAHAIFCRIWAAHGQATGPGRPPPARSPHA